MTRRSFLRTLLATAAVAPLILAGLTWGRPAAEEGQPVRFRWRVPEAHRETVEGSLRYTGTVEDEQNKKGGWVVVIAGLALLPYLAESILELMRQVEQGGVIIDACGPEVEVETNKRMPLGLVVVRSCKDQDVKLHWEKMAGPSELAGVIKKAMGAK